MAIYPAGHLPYCGAPPTPAEILIRWRLDPVVLALLAAALAFYVIGARRSPSRGAELEPWRQAAFYAGWLVGTLALVSPICPLSVSLFAARAGQHMLLTLVAAPLVVAGRPLAAFRAALAGLGSPRMRPRGRLGAGSIYAAGAFTAVLWFWHAPAPYAETFASTAIYWTMHVTMFASAAWLWSELLDLAGERPIQVMLASLFSCVQMGFLGAVITFAPRPLYAPHALTTAAWGLTQLDDQQLGGAIMWVPGSVVFLLVSLLVLGLMMSGASWRAGPRAAGAHA